MQKRKQKKPETGFEEWGDYMDAKISKLEEQFLEDAKKLCLKISSIFAGISIFVNGYTNPSADELKRIMMQHGGVFHNYKRPTTTYVIASNLPDVKIKSITSAIIISPQWVVDCVAQNRIVDYKKYLLYSNHKPSQPKLTFEKEDKKPEQSPGEDKYLNLIKELQFLNAEIRNTDSPDLFPSQTSEEPDDFEVLEQKQELETAPKNICKSAVDPNFLTEFFSNSRLHHIATLGAGFKQHIAELRENHNGIFPDRDNLKHLASAGENFDNNSRKIMHIDMDCFFVSVGLKSRPHLRGFPVAVTHSKGSQAGKAQDRPGMNRQLEIDMYQKRLENKLQASDIPLESTRLHNINDHNSMSEIASCSYEARKLGVKNGMFVGSALKLCPDLKTIPYDFEGYREVAFTLYNTIAKYTLDIEAVSCDEMFVDLTDLLNATGVECLDFVKFVRDEIKGLTGCPCSAGVGDNRLRARLATRKAKPDGEFYLSSAAIEDFMNDILISDLPGVGHNTTHRLSRLSWKTCGDLKNVPKVILQREFGNKFGETLFESSRGIDNKPLVYEKIRKSVSAEVNYGIRFKENTEVETFLRQLCEEVHKRLMDCKKRGKCITLKLMIRSTGAPVETAKYMGHGLCDSVNKSITLKDFTNDLSVIQNSIISLFKQQDVPPQELRGIGIQLSKFDESKLAKEEPKNTLKNMFQKMEKAESKSPTKMTQKQIKLEITPTKIFSYSPLKSQHVQKKEKGMKIAPKARTEISRMFKNADAKKEDDDDIHFEGVDPEVLAALPANIREEILKECRRQKKIKLEAHKCEDELNNIDALPLSLIKELESKIKSQPASASLSENIFLKKDWKFLLKSWVESADSPQEYDVNMLSENARELVAQKKLNELYICLRYLFRMIEERSRCHWHQAYFRIVSLAQIGMRDVYNSNLAVRTDFNCKLGCVPHE